MVSSQPEGPQVLTEPLLGVAEAGGKGQEATHFIFALKKPGANLPEPPEPSSHDSDFSAVPAETQGSPVAMSSFAS